MSGTQFPSAWSNEDLFRFEEKRLETFEKWPETAPVEAKRLAKAGFFYNGTGLAVTCFSCKVTIADWVFDDKPIVKHKNTKPQCDFILNKSKNVSLMAMSRIRRLINEGDTAEVKTQPADKTWTSLSSLLHESERLKTFKDWPSDDARQLAAIGFFYLCCKSSSIQCVFCNGILEWQTGCDPCTEHFLHFPKCPLLRGYDVGNVTLRQEAAVRARRVEGDLATEKTVGSVDKPNCRWCRKTWPERTRRSTVVEVRRPTSPHYSSVEARMKSFNDLPLSDVQQPTVLAEAGFYYAGISDHTKCFFCDGGIRNWGVHDSPWITHVQYFENCGFMLEVKGRHFINEVIRLSATSQTADLFMESDSAKIVLAKRIPEEFVRVASLQCMQRDSRMPDEHMLYTACMDLIMRTPVVEGVLETDMPRELIQEAMERHLKQTGKLFVESDSLYDGCVVIENISRY